MHSASLAILDGTVQIRRRAEDCLVCSVFVHCPSLSLTGQWGSVPHTRYPLLSTSAISIVRNSEDEKCREPEYRSFSIANHRQHLQVTAFSSIDTPTRFGIGPISCLSTQTRCCHMWVKPLLLLRVSVQLLAAISILCLVTVRFPFSRNRGMLQAS